MATKLKLYKYNNLKVETVMEKENIDALIVDDEEDICYLLGNLLKQKKLNLEYANTLQAAKNILRYQYPEIIFLDNNLPDGLGIDFIRYIKKVYPLAKVILITAHDCYDTKNKAFIGGLIIL